ncbi:MAG TPA: ATP-binding protein, partial [Bryobacteraceae bacterium]|nr:ATP-binding protein [Bryobacteraceae bacterium]
ASLQSRPVLDSLGRSDRETFIAAWLEERGVRVAWKLAPLLVDMEWTDADLEDLGARFDQGDLPCVFARLTATISVGQLLTQLDDATKRISKLVDTLKSYSHMDRAPESEVDLHEGLDSTLDMFHSRFSGFISVVKTYDESIPPMVVHGGALNQVWTSLFDNALDAMPDGGALRIRTTRERDCALIEVIDSGVGIPDNLRARVFEPFFTTKPFGKAMGLGLDTAFRIVRRHHGHITFVSRPGETRFQVRLPFRRQYGM